MRIPHSVFYAAALVSLAACSGGNGDDRGSGDTGDTSGAETSVGGSGEASASAGEAVFRRCMSCHSIEPGENRVGPTMHAVIGREIGSVSGFNYSDANQGTSGEWTAENLDEYLENPRAFMPGTTMVFAGIPNEQDRADLIAYLETLN